MLSNALAILFALCLCAFVIWWGINRDHWLFLIGIPFCLAHLFVCGVFIRNMRRPKSAILAIDDSCLTWIVRRKESEGVKRESIPLKSIRSLELVLPKFKDEINARNYSIAQIFLVDIHGNHYRIPEELWPGVYHKQIIAAIKQEIPGIEVSERIDK